MKPYIAVFVSAVLLVGCGGVKSVVSKTREVITPAKTELKELAPASGVATARKLWERDTGSGTDGRDLKLVAAVESGRVHTADAKGHVTAHDSDGKPVWSRDLKLPVSGGVAAGAGLVLAGTMDGELVALRADSGEPAWRSQLSSEILSPAVVGEGVVVARTVDGKVFGLSAADGSKLWIYERGVPSLTLRGTAASVLAGNRVLTGFASGKLVANDLASGRVLWESSIGFARGRNELERLIDVDSRPVVFGDQVYTAAYQGKVVAVGLADGRAKWEQTVSTHNDIAVDDSRVYVSETGGRVVALDRNSGKELWSQPALSGHSPGSPVLAGRWLVLMDAQGVLHLLDSSDGSLAGRLVMERRDAGARLSVSDSRVYVLNADGGLGAIGVGG